MPQLCIIRPEFHTFDGICALSPQVRLLHIGLWHEADREGPLVRAPKVSKRCYLLDIPFDVDGISSALITSGQVVPYGEGLAHIPTRLRHQLVNAREAQSKLPVPKDKAPAQFRVNGARRREGDEKEGVRKEVLLLHHDWTPDEEDVDWAVAQRPDLDDAEINEESQHFRHDVQAYRRAAHDWFAAWCHWINRAYGPDEQRGGYRKLAVAADSVHFDDVSETQWRARPSKYRPGPVWLMRDWGPRLGSGQLRAPAPLPAEWQQRCGGAPKIGEGP